MAVKSLPKKRKLRDENALMVYCRKCMETKPSNTFYTSTDTELDSNKFMSICKSCCNSIYENNFVVEKSFEKALLKTCKSLNIAWVAQAVDSTKSHVDKWKQQGKTDIQVFGIYKSKLSTLANLAGDKTLTFEEYPTVESVISNTPEQDESQSYQELQKFWGNKSFEEIEYLQNNFNAIGGPDAKDDWTKQTLLQEVCLARLEVKKKRDAGQTAKDELKVMTDLMQNAAIRPDQKKVSDGSKSSDAFGVWLADIEQYKPCEWYQQQDIYKDVNDIKGYWDTHILRPFLNFWGIQKDFNFPGAVERDGSEDDSESSGE